MDHTTSEGADGRPVAKYMRRMHLATFGLTEDQYDTMLAAQGGVCAICGKQCKSGRRLAVDHDHNSGRVRGLLCIPCNTQLGKIERFRARVDAYLSEYGLGNPHLPEGAGLVRSKPGKRGGLRKVSAEQVIEIRQRYAAGEIQRSIASDFGIVRTTVGKIVNGQSWRNLPD